jgi:hypothetical protein
MACCRRPLNADKKESQRQDQAKAQETPGRQGDHPQKDRGDQKKASEEGADSALITQENHADRERRGQTEAGQPASTSHTDAQPAPQLTPPGERVGVVTHYYSHLSVATLRLESGTLRVGDVIRIGGHTTDFSQRVESVEVNHAPATEVGPNDDFGLKVVGHVREHDVVYKVRP